MQVFVHGIDIVEAIERRGRVGRFRLFLFEAREQLQSGRIVPADFFIRR